MSFRQQVHVTGHDRQRHHRPAVLAGLRADQLLTPALNPVRQGRTPALRAPHDATPEIADATGGNLYLPDHASDDTHRLCQASRFRRRPKMAVLSRGA
jgi:hypothetical protein